MAFKLKKHKDATAAALHILAVREHTVFELTQKLKLREFSDAEIDEAVKQCQAWNYLNDERAAQILVKTLVRKGRGLNKINLELKKRRVDEGLAQQALAEFGVAENQMDVALEAITKKFIPAITYDEAYKQKGKIFRFLQSRGFSSDAIYQAIRIFYNA